MLELQVTDEGKIVKLKFEHSLLSLSKWEQNFKKPFLTAEKTAQEMIDYFKCMQISPDDNDYSVYLLAPEQLEQLGEYINESRTASSVPKSKDNAGPRETITSELIYYWLRTLKIPFSPTEEWHLSRLMVLVEMTIFKDKPPEKQRASDFMSEWRAANEENRKRFNSKG